MVSCFAIVFAGTHFLCHGNLPYHLCPHDLHDPASQLHNREGEGGRKREKETRGINTCIYTGIISRTCTCSFCIQEVIGHSNVSKKLIACHSVQGGREV
jgi:hypothetical protein